MPKFFEGQRVTYKPVGGPHSRTPCTSGIIRAVFTSPSILDGKNIRATMQHPRYVIENERTKKKSAILERNILTDRDSTSPTVEPTINTDEHRKMNAILERKLGNRNSKTEGTGIPMSVNKRLDKMGLIWDQISSSDVASLV